MAIVATLERVSVKYLSIRQTRVFDWITRSRRHHFRNTAHASRTDDQLGHSRFQHKMKQ